MILDYEPGDKVTNPNNKDWGIGQVQSMINGKVTINFENVGKKVINSYLISLEKISNKKLIYKNMDKKINQELQSATFERLLNHLQGRKDVQNIDLMNLSGFCRNCLSKWYKEEADKKGVEISDLEAREHIYGMPYSKWKEKYQK